MKRNWGKIRRFIPLYLMLLPGLVYLFINNYMPMAGIVHSRNIITAWES